MASHDTKSDGSGEPLPDFNYREMCLSLLRAPAAGQHGMSVDEVRQRIRVLDKVEAYQGPAAIAFEDSEWETLNRVVKNATWLRASKDVLDFVDHIATAPKEDPTERPANQE